MSASPLEQFKITDLIELKFGGYDLSFTNSAFFMLIGFLITTTFFIAALRRATPIPGKLQSAGEMLHNFIFDTLQENTAGKGEKYMPFIFSLFVFVLTLNLLGLVPYGFTATSHLSVTFTLAIIVFILVTVIAILQHKMKFFSFFLPTGTPLFLAPLMIVIELFTYLTRPISLSVRLAANMMAGHILLSVIAGFVTVLGFWGWLPMSFIILFDGFEFFVAVLQAYIFTILSCVYLNDAINLH
jgi:F-type H+-transporting ATPase subunit a